MHVARIEDSQLPMNIDERTALAVAQRLTVGTICLNGEGILGAADSLLPLDIRVALGRRHVSPQQTATLHPQGPGQGLQDLLHDARHRSDPHHPSSFLPPSLFRLLRYLILTLHRPSPPLSTCSPARSGAFRVCHSSRVPFSLCFASASSRALLVSSCLGSTTRPVSP
jgi:hypothetical protein